MYGTHIQMSEFSLFTNDEKEKEKVNCLPLGTGVSSKLGFNLAKHSTFL